LTRALTVLAAATLTAGAASEPGFPVVASNAPAVRASGPDAEDYGATPAGFPRASWSNFFQIRYLVDSNSRLDEIFPRLCRRSGRDAEAPWPGCRRAGDHLSLSRREPRALDDYLARYPVTGLLIARGDTILVERYQYDRRDTHRFTSWSMAKTVTSMLVGIALDEGLIRSIDDRHADYVPALAGTEYSQTPVPHLLTMSSGVRFSEDYSGRDDVSKLAANTFRGVGPGGPAAVTGFNQRDAESGTRFVYASVETQVLGLVLRAGARRPDAMCLSDKIWRSMGAEADGTWLIDSSGQEATYCCLNAVLRDRARLAMLPADDGRRGDRQIIPRPACSRRRPFPRTRPTGRARWRRPISATAIRPGSSPGSADVRPARGARPGDLRRPGREAGAGALTRR